MGGLRPPVCCGTRSSDWDRRKAGPASIDLRRGEGQLPRGYPPLQRVACSSLRSDPRPLPGKTLRRERLLGAHHPVGWFRVSSRRRIAMPDETFREARVSCSPRAKRRIACSSHCAPEHSVRCCCRSCLDVDDQRCTTYPGCNASLSQARRCRREELLHRTGDAPYPPTRGNAIGVPPSEGRKRPKNPIFGGSWGDHGKPRKMQKSAKNRQKSPFFAPPENRPTQFLGVPLRKPSHKKKLSVPTGGVIKYPQKSALFCPPGRFFAPGPISGDSLRVPGNSVPGVQDRPAGAKSAPPSLGWSPR